MSTTDYSTGPGPAGESWPAANSAGTDTGAKEQAQETAGTAKQEGQRVAGVAKDEALDVADAAKDHARALLDDATTQLEGHSKEQTAKLAETVRTFGDDLDSMKTQGSGSNGLAGQLVQQVAERANRLASHLEDREPRELLEDVRGYARRSPGTFLIGALAAGVVVGRLTRGAKAAQDQQRDEPVRQPLAEPMTPSVTQPVTQSPASSGPLPSSEAGIVAPDGGRA